MGFINNQGVDAKIIKVYVFVLARVCQLFKAKLQPLDFLFYLLSCNPLFLVHPLQHVFIFGNLFRNEPRFCFGRDRNTIKKSMWSDDGIPIAGGDTPEQPFPVGLGKVILVRDQNIRIGIEFIKFIFPLV